MKARTAKNKSPLRLLGPAIVREAVLRETVDGFLRFYYSMLPCPECGSVREFCNREGSLIRVWHDSRLDLGRAVRWSLLMKRVKGRAA